MTSELGNRTRRSYRMAKRAADVAATRERILKAAQQAFIEAHYEDVTLNDIADAAAASRQTVLNHFESKDELFAEAADSMTVPRDQLRGPADRDRLVPILIEEYELLGDALIRLLAVEDRIPAVAKLMPEARAEHQELLAMVFADVLPARGRRRTLMLGAIHAALDVYLWKLLRRDLGFSVAETTDVLERFLATAIGDGAEPKPAAPAPKRRATAPSQPQEQKEDVL